MEKLWTGRTTGASAALADAFNRSIAFDARMFEEDITGSMAHAAMLGAVGILPQASVDNILAGLEGILSDLKCGLVKIDPLAEDIHSFVEFELTRRIGDDGKKLHTARSRNDQVALDLRLALKKEIIELVSLTKTSDRGDRGRGRAAQRNGDARIHPPAARAARHLRALDL